MSKRDVLTTDPETAATAAAILRKLAAGEGFATLDEIAKTSGNSVAARERRVRAALTAAAAKLDA